MYCTVPVLDRRSDGFGNTISRCACICMIKRNVILTLLLLPLTDVSVYNDIPCVVIPSSSREHKISAVDVVENNSEPSPFVNFIAHVASS